MLSITRVVALALASIVTLSAHAASTVFKDVRVFDGENVVEQTSVLVTDGVIAGIGNVKAPSDSIIVEGRGKTLIPGLIDAHVHVFSNDSLKEALRFGVTTQLDMFTDKSLLAQFKAARTSLAATGYADVFSAGTLITAPGGHGTEYGMPIPTLPANDDAVAFVDARVNEGSDYIKLVLEDGSAFNGQFRFESLDVRALKAAIKAAHDRKKLTVVHVSTLADGIAALEAGADGLAHSFFDKVADDKFISLAREKKAFVIATLSVTASIAGADPGKALLQDDALKPFLLTNQRTQLAAMFQNRIATALPNAFETVRKLQAARIPILAGTDAGNPGTAAGVSLHGELEFLVAAGLQPIEALRSSTSIPAKVFGLEGRGHIAAGKRADLVLLDGDPTSDIKATRRIAGIWKNGHALKREPTPPKVNGTKAPEGFPISDFDAGPGKSRFGMWVLTTDAMRGGKSTATISVVDGGSENSAKALRVAGVTAAGSMVWAGAMYNPGATQFAPMDFSSRHAISFWTRGDGRTYQVMVFSGESMQGAPSVLTIDTTKDQWQQHRLALNQFAGADFGNVRGIAIVAVAPAGPFELLIDSFGVE